MLVMYEVGEQTTTVVEADEVRMRTDEGDAPRCEVFPVGWDPALGEGRSKRQVVLEGGDAMMMFRRAVKEGAPEGVVDLTGMQEGSRRVLVD